MKQSLQRTQLPPRKNLENYAIAYAGAYMNAVRRERPDNVPVLARSAPHKIEVCMLPNKCFCMLFERSDKDSVTVAEADWKHVEERVASGVLTLVAVYAHEGVTVADAIAKGKRDAVRDIRSLEDSKIAKAVTHLENILEGLKEVEQGNKGLLKLAELELERLQPIKEAIATAGPDVDMLAIVDALKNYPTTPVEVSIDIKEKELLENLASELGDLSDLIRRVEAQDQRLEEMEKSLKKTFSEFNRTIDERISKGLAVVLSSSDKKIDKGFAALSTVPTKEIDVNLLKELAEKLRKLEETLDAVQMKRSLSDELVLAIAEVKDNLAKLNVRVTKIESFLVQTTTRTRVLKAK
ncbi:MAG: hypothetical protein ACUVT7_09360 [Thermoplasmata archaeon]